MWAASTFLGLRLPYWEIWLPLVVGMVVGVLSILTLRALSGERPPIPAPAPPEKKVSMPAPDPFVHGSALEQRRSLRRCGSPVPVLLKKPDDKEASWQAWVFDRSVGGLGLVANGRFPEGVLLKVIPVNASEATPWTDIEVRSCRRGEDGYELGCQFLKTPPWSVLLLFG